MSTDPVINRLKQGKVECLVSFTDDETKAAEEQALKELGKNVKIEGFREGNVPADMLREKVDEADLVEETIRILLPSAFEKLEDQDLKPIMPPKVEAESRDPLTVKIILIERPEVKLKGIGKIKVEKPEPKVDDKDIDRMVDYLLKQHQTTVVVDRAAKEDDQVTMDFWAADAVSGKEVPEIRSEGYQVIIGSGSLLPGFEDSLKGKKAGDTAEFPLTFPEKYHAESLQNKPVTFHVTLKQVEEVNLPKLTDEFAKEKLNAESADKLKEQIRESMVLQEEDMSRQNRQKSLFESIAKAATVDLAEELVTYETQQLFEELQNQLKQQNITLEQWLTHSKMTSEEAHADMQKKAIDRLTLRLAMQQLVDEKAPEMSDDDMKAHVTDFLSQAPEEQRKEMEELYKPGKPHYEELKWQRRVELVVAEMLK